MLTRLTVGALVAGAAVITAATLSAAPDSKAPRIVSAAMQDADGDGRADGLRVTYSERVRHRADRDGQYPFQVAGYTISSVGRSSGKTVVLALVEPAAVDAAARPSLSYRRTSARPVLDLAGHQAAPQVFRGVRAHGNRPAGPTDPQPTLPVNPTTTDRDGDGTPDERDCAPDDPAVRPGAPDAPDLQFLDSNCDGIDGTERGAIFVSPLGKDTNPGTKAAPSGRSTRRSRAPLPAWTCTRPRGHTSGSG